MIRQRYLLKYGWRHDYYFVERRKDISTFPEFIYYMLTCEDESMNAFVTRAFNEHYRRSRKNALVLAHDRTYAASVTFERLGCFGVAVKKPRYTSEKSRIKQIWNYESFYRRNGDRFVTLHFDTKKQQYFETRFACYDRIDAYDIGQF